MKDLYLVLLASLLVFSLSCDAAPESQGEADCSERISCSRTNKFCDLKSIIKKQKESSLTVTLNDFTQGIEWKNYSETMFVEATKHDRLILLFVQLDQCAWSARLQGTTFHNKMVVKLINKNFIPLRINVDNDPDIGMKYQVTRFPSTLFMNQDRKIIKVFEGVYYT